MHTDDEHGKHPVKLQHDDDPDEGHKVVAVSFDVTDLLA